MDYHLNLNGTWVETYWLLLTLAILLSVGLTLWRLWSCLRHHNPDPEADALTRLLATLAPYADALLAALGGALLGARALHVLLNWAYFQLNLDDILRWDGLDWHGALLGGMALAFLRFSTQRATSPLNPLSALLRTYDGAASNFKDGTHQRADGEGTFKTLFLGSFFPAPLVGFLRQPAPLVAGAKLTLLLAACAPAVGLITIAGWTGCVAAVCGAGAEVADAAAYPPLLIAETVDLYGTFAPRFNTHLLGVLLGIFALLPVFFSAPLRLYVKNRPDASSVFWNSILILALGMFLIGFLRGDYAPHLAGLRADQWLDLTVSLIALKYSAIFQRRSMRASRPMG